MTPGQTALTFTDDLEPIMQEMAEYYRHLTGQYDHVVEVEPMPTPRARAVARMMGNKPIATVYNPSEYTKYKKDIIKIVKAKDKLKLGTYSRIYARFHLPYPMSTPKSKLIDGAPHIKQKDVDNFLKGLMDALQGSQKENIIGVLENDATIHKACAMKVYTTQPIGFISFTIIP